MMFEKKWLALLGISLSSLLVFIDIAIVNVALAAIQQSFNASFLQLQWVMNSYLLLYCIFLTIMGRFSDLLGARRINYFGVILFGISSLTAGLSPNIISLIISRAVQGAAIAMIIPSSLALIAHTFPVRERVKSIGIWSSITGVGLIIGPVLGGLLLSYLNWRWIFFINIPVVIVSLIICLLSVPEYKTREKTRIDWAGFFFIVLGIGSLVLAIIQGPEWGWHSAITLSLFILAILSFTILFIIEKRIVPPIIQFNLFYNRIFLACAAGYFTLVCLMFTGLFFIPLFLHTVLQLPSKQVGLMILPITVIVVILSPFISNITRAITEKNTIILGFVALTLSMFMQIFFKSGTAFVMLLMAFVLFGMGWALTFSTMKSEAISSLPDKFAGIAAGLLTAIDSLGGVLGLAIAGVIFRYYENEGFVVGYAKVMQFLFVLSLLTLLFITFLLWHTPKLERE